MSIDDGRDAVRYAQSEWDDGELDNSALVEFIIEECEDPDTLRLAREYQWKYHEVMSKAMHEDLDAAWDAFYAALSRYTGVTAKEQGIASKLKCPKCGCEDVSQFVYLEDIINCRKVLHVEDDGTLVIDGHYDTDGYDDGDNPRLQCHNEVSGDAPDSVGNICMHEFPIPDDVETDFV